MPTGFKVDWQGRDAELREMVARGCLLSEIGAAFGCTKSPVSRRLQKMGLCVAPEALAAVRRRASEFAKSPVGRERISQAVRKHYAEHPEALERLGQLSKARWQDTAFRALIADKIRVHAATPQGRASRSVGGKHDRLKRIPAGYRELYLSFSNRGDTNAAEAERLVREQIAADQRRAAKQAAAAPKLTPWERTQAAIAAGTLGAVYDPGMRAPTLDAR